MKKTTIKLIPLMIGITMATIAHAQNITGASTTNYVLKFTNTSGSTPTAGNSLLFDNGTNVGIGYSGAGSYKLDVNGDLNAGGGSANTSNAFRLGTNKILWVNGNSTCVFVGPASGNSGTTPGNNNTAVGVNTLYNLTGSGTQNTAVGTQAMYFNSGNANTAIGNNAMIGTANNTAGFNTAVGSWALGSVTTNGDYNTGIGANSLAANTTGLNNTAIGYLSLYTNQGGYQNTAAGVNALKNNISGYDNSAFGFAALGSNTSNFNNAFGFYALNANTSGSYNHAFGNFSMAACTSGVKNCAFGDSTLYSLLSGFYNVAIGNGALKATTGSYNTATGYWALHDNTGDNNSAFGFRALKANTTGSNNNAFGYQTLQSVNTGSFNVGVGDNALSTSTSASYNTAIGYNAGKVLTGDRSVFVGAFAGLDANTAVQNVFVGYEAGQKTTSSSYNTVVGYAAEYYNTNGNGANTIVGYEAGLGQSGYGYSENSFFGYKAGFADNSGGKNTALGWQAGVTIAGGSYNTCVGYGADVGVATYTNSGAFGNGAVSTGNDKYYVGNATFSGLFSSAGQFTTSDGRFKTNITENVKGLDFINKLRPVTYNMDTKSFDDFVIQNMPDSIKAKHRDNMDFTASTARIHSGFIAQEVEQAGKDANFTSSIVSAPTNSSDPYALNYAEIVVPLVKAIQELSHKVDSLLGVTNGGQQRKIQNNTNGSQDNKGVSSINVELSNMDVIVLNEAAPNPFAEQTLITFLVPEKYNKAQMLFYDGSGLLLKSVDIQKRGKGQMYVFGTDLMNGTYSYTLIVDGKIIDTKRMVKQN